MLCITACQQRPPSPSLLATRCSFLRHRRDLRRATHCIARAQDAAPATSCAHQGVRDGQTKEAARHDPSDRCRALTHRAASPRRSPSGGDLSEMGDCRRDRCSVLTRRERLADGPGGGSAVANVTSFSGTTDGSRIVPPHIQASRRGRGLQLKGSAPRQALARTGSRTFGGNDGRPRNTEKSRMGGPSYRGWSRRNSNQQSRQGTNCGACPLLLRRTDDFRPSGTLKS